MDHSWLIMIRKTIMPKLLPPLPEENLASSRNDGTLIIAVVNTKSVKDIYEVKMEKYE